MKEILSEYGGVIIAILAIALILALMGPAKDLVATHSNDLVNQFGNAAGTAAQNALNLMP